MQIVETTNHAAQAIDRLTDQFKGKVKIEGLITAIVNQLQDIETAAYQVIHGTYLGDAIGVQLDRVGKIVGAERQGRSDEDYENYIYAKIGQNVSNGTREDLIAIFNLLTGSTRSHYMNIGGGACAIMANLDISALNTDDIKTFCQEVLCVGVRLDYVGWFDDDEAFGFAGDINALGFGTLADLSLGGKLSSLV